MRGATLVPKITLTSHMPRTSGEDQTQKKAELRDKILLKIKDNLEEYRRRCRGNALALEVVFYLSEDKEKGSPRDLDNMLKILCDTLPDHIDKTETEPGLRLIEGTGDSAIYDIHCTKRIVKELGDEAIDLEIFEWISDNEPSTSGDLKRINRAASFAKEKHRHQLRKDGHTMYWHHLESVANNAMKLGVSDEDVLCACWLHDTIEDTNTDFDDIAEKFGTDVANIVAEVTKDKRLEEEGREEHYRFQLAEASWKAQVVKLCDIWANIADIPSGYVGQQKRTEQAEKKLAYFEAIRKGLRDNKGSIPKIDEGMEELNTLLSTYGKAVRL